MQGFLSVNGIKFYESKMNLNWKPIIKSIQEVCSPSKTLQCKSPLYLGNRP